MQLTSTSLMTEINDTDHKKYLQKIPILNNLMLLFKQASFFFYYIILKIMVLHWKGKYSNSWFWNQVPKVTFYELNRLKDVALFGLRLYFLKCMNAQWFLLTLCDVFEITTIISNLFLNYYIQRLTDTYKL